MSGADCKSARLIEVELDETWRLWQLNISGAGIRLTTSERFAQGDMLEIKTFLSPQKHRALRLYGRIIALDERPEGYQMSLSFVKMDDMVRDEIVKFVFEREREILREKRGR